MHAADIAAPLVVVDRSTPALDAIRLIAEQDLPGLVVSEHDGHPSVVVSGIDVVRYMLPDYLRGDLALTNTVGDAGVDDLRQELQGRSFGDLVDSDQVPVRDVLVVPPDAGLVELAARMVDGRTQIALVDDPSRSEPGFITLPALLDAVVARWDRADDERGAAR